MNIRKILRSFICWVILFSIPAVTNGGEDFTNELKNFDEAKNPIPLEYLQNVYKKSELFLSATAITTISNSLRKSGVKDHLNKVNS